MARIPETELERLKSEVSVERLVEASGVELKRGGKDTNSIGSGLKTVRLRYQVLDFVDISRSCCLREPRGQSVRVNPQKYRKRTVLGQVLPFAIMPLVVLHCVIKYPPVEYQVGTRPHSRIPPPDSATHAPQE